MFTNDKKKSTKTPPHPFPPKLENLKFIVQKVAPGNDFRAEGNLVISGITINECLFIGRVLHECWHHDRHVLIGILFGLTPETMKAHWELGAEIERSTRKAKTVRKKAA